MLIHSKIHYKRRKDLETEGTSTLWIQLTYPGKKPLLIQGVYRQFQRLGNKNLKSDSIKAQKARWDQILTKWEVALDENKEIISLGDFNLNSIGWDTPMEMKTQYQKLQYPMVEQFRDRILDKGTKILNSGPTRLKDTVEAKPACLDFILTNKIDKVVSFQSEIPSFSDHSIQILHRSMKKIKSNPKYIRMRSLKNFDREQYKDNIKNHYFYIEALHERDPENITKMLQTIIKESIDPMAPMKVVQISSKNTNNLTENTKLLLAKRDMAFEEFKRSNSIEDLRNYRHIKNQVNKEISTEKFKRKKAMFKNEELNVNDRWKLIKE